jgi:hypothetical protein
MLARSSQTLRQVTRSAAIRNIGVKQIVARQISVVASCPPHALSPPQSVGSFRGFAKKKKKAAKKGKAAVVDDDSAGDAEDEEDEELIMEEFDAAKVKKHMSDSCAKAVESFKTNLKGVRSGRPDAKMFDHLFVEAYGALSPLNAVGVVQIKSAKLVQITVFDPEVFRRFFHRHFVGVSEYPILLRFVDGNGGGEGDCRLRYEPQPIFGRARRERAYPAVRGFRLNQRKSTTNIFLLSLTPCPPSWCFVIGFSFGFLCSATQENRDALVKVIAQLSEKVTDSPPTHPHTHTPHIAHNPSLSNSHDYLYCGGVSIIIHRQRLGFERYGGQAWTS